MARCVDRGAAADRVRREVVEIQTHEPGKGELLERNHFAGLDYIEQETSPGVHNRSVARSLKRSPVVAGIEMAVVPPEMSLEGVTSVVGGALTTITAFGRKANPRAGHQVLITGATRERRRHRGAVPRPSGCRGPRCVPLRAGRLRAGAGAIAYDRSEMPDPIGRFDVVFDSVYPLHHSDEAFERQLRSGKRGKILLDMRDR